MAQVRLTIAGVCRDMISKGKTDQEIWRKISRQFDLDDSKKTYPAWYRREMARKQKATHGSRRKAA